MLEAHFYTTAKLGCRVINVDTKRLTSDTDSLLITLCSLDLF